jgi:hypothetical protein
MKQHIYRLFFILFCGILPLLAEEFTIGEKTTLSGIWENNSKIIQFSSEKNSVVLKTFYGFFYDGNHTLYPFDSAISVAVIDSDLYLEYWKKDNPTTGIQGFWKPCASYTDLTIDKNNEKKELTGYYILEDSNGNYSIYLIRYWKANIAYTSDKATVIIGPQSDPDLPSQFFVDKHIQIGNTVYTCVPGRRKEVRNISIKENLMEDIRFSSDNTLMVMGKPFMTKSLITDLDKAISEHNSIVYPPHHSTINWTEPSIYKKLEEMSINQL